MPRKKKRGSAASRKLRAEFEKLSRGVTMGLSDRGIERARKAATSLQRSKTMGAMDDGDRRALRRIMGGHVAGTGISKRKSSGSHKGVPTTAGGRAAMKKRAAKKRKTGMAAKRKKYGGRK